MSGIMMLVGRRVAMALAVGLSSSPLTAQQFYRVEADSATMLTGLDRSGVLYWTNATGTGTYRIDRRGAVAEAGWTPYSRGVLSNEAVSVKVVDFALPAGMVFIPGGRFTMGDILGDHSTATPVHPAEVGPFYLQSHEVNNRELREVIQWGYDQGLVRVTGDLVESVGGQPNGLLDMGTYAAEISFSGGVFSIEAGREDFPCVYVSWYGAVAYCNLRSQMEGREPCYEPGGAECDFSRNGYRLPTEAEWEFAARGGFEGHRFPWGDSDLITHDRANYRSSVDNAYDVSLTRDFHPDYAANPLRTSPVGAFPPNPYGLFDMSGNVWEWCWDWATRYPRELQIDPTGPESGTFKIFRGGSNYTTAERVTCAVRYLSATPTGYGYDIGFRTAISHPR